MEIYFASLSLTICAIATYTDIKSRTIPNSLSFIGLPIALLFIFWGQDSIDPQSYLISGGISALLMIACFYAKIFGGGDAKLLILLGFCVPAQALIWLWFYISIIGGIEAIFYIINKKKVKQKIPYAIAIFGGTILFWIDFWV